MTRVRLFVLILALPALIMLGDLLSRQVVLWGVSAPRWVVDAEARFYGTCHSASHLESYDGAAVDDLDAAAIDRERARDLSRLVVERAYGPVMVQFVYGPKLADVTFPDGEERLAWYQVILFETSQSGMMGHGVVVYLDAESGDPLLLIRGVNVGDPIMVCGMELVPSRRSVLLLMLVSYLLLVGIFGGLLWLLRRKRLSRSAS